FCLFLHAPALSFDLPFPPFLTVRQPPTLTLFPYTTLFRSGRILQFHRLPSLRPARRQDDRQQHRGSGGGRSAGRIGGAQRGDLLDRKSTRLNSSHQIISYAVFCLKKKNYE